MFLIYVCFYLALEQNFLRTSAAITKRPTDLPIQYPGPASAVDPSRYEGVDSESRVPEACRGQSFCTVKPQHYPEAAIRQALKNRGKQRPQPQLQLVDENSIGNRQGDPSEDDNCRSKVSFEPLYMVRDKRNTWATVVQDPATNYKQNIRLETCSNKGSACFTVASFPTNIKAYCKQKFSSWTLEVIDETTEKTSLKTINLPTCCVCQYEYVDN